MGSGLYASDPASMLNAFTAWDQNRFNLAQAAAKDREAYLDDQANRAKQTSAQFAEQLDARKAGALAKMKAEYGDGFGALSADQVEDELAERIIEDDPDFFLGGATDFIQQNEFGKRAFKELVGNHRDLEAFERVPVEDAGGKSTGQYAYRVRVKNSKLGRSGILDNTEDGEVSGKGTQHVTLTARQFLDNLANLGDRAASSRGLLTNATESAAIRDTIGLHNAAQQAQLATAIDEAKLSAAAQAQADLANKQSTRIEYTGFGGLGGAAAGTPDTIVTGGGAQTRGPVVVPRGEGLRRGTEDVGAGMGEAQSATDRFLAGTLGAVAAQIVGAKDQAVGALKQAVGVSGQQVRSMWNPAVGASIDAAADAGNFNREDIDHFATDTLYKRGEAQRKGAYTPERERAQSRREVEKRARTHIKSERGVQAVLARYDELHATPATNSPPKGTPAAPYKAGQDAVGALPNAAAVVGSTTATKAVAQQLGDTIQRFTAGYKPADFKSVYKAIAQAKADSNTAVELTPRQARLFAVMQAAGRAGYDTTSLLNVAQGKGVSGTGKNANDALVAELEKAIPASFNAVQVGSTVAADRAAAEHYAQSTALEKLKVFLSSRKPNDPWEVSDFETMLDIAAPGEFNEQARSDIGAVIANSQGTMRRLGLDMSDPNTMQVLVYQADRVARAARASGKRTFLSDDMTTVDRANLDETFMRALEAAGIARAQAPVEAPAGGGRVRAADFQGLAEAGKLPPAMQAGYNAIVADYRAKKISAEEANSRAQDLLNNQ